MGKVKDEEFKIVIGPEQNAKVKRGETVVKPDNLYTFPVYGFTFWNGTIRNDDLGNVFPDIVNSNATFGTIGVVVSNTDDTKLNFTGFLDTKLSYGCVRVDQYIGLIPDSASRNRNDYVAHGNKLKDPVILAKIIDDGFNLIVPEYFVSQSLLAKVAQEEVKGSSKHYANIEAKVRAGYEDWNKVFAEALKLTEQK